MTHFVLNRFYKSKKLNFQIGTQKSDEDKDKDVFEVYVKRSNASNLMDNML